MQGNHRVSRRESLKDHKKRERRIKSSDELPMKLWAGVERTGSKVQNETGGESSWRRKPTI